MGVAGASISPHGILMTGISGLLAGARTIALGEWVSMTSSRELAEREIRIESSDLLKTGRQGRRGAANLRSERTLQ